MQISRGAKDAAQTKCDSHVNWKHLCANGAICANLPGVYRLHILYCLVCYIHIPTYNITEKGSLPQTKYDNLILKLWCAEILVYRISIKSTARRRRRRICGMRESISHLHITFSVYYAISCCYSICGQVLKKNHPL